MKTFQLDKRNAMFLGVCSGIANWVGVDVTLVRIGAVVATVLGGFPWTFVLYAGLAWIARPKADSSAGRSKTDTASNGIRSEMRDIDRRLAEVETYVTSPNVRLARDIEELR
jgi:phage shock protein C